MFNDSPYNNAYFPVNFDCQAVTDIVHTAGEKLLLPAFKQHLYGTMERKPDGSMVTALDHKSQQMICQQLAHLTPSFAFLGEEMDPRSQQQRINHSEQPCWCLDPLDGTSNFIAGMPCFAISLGLLMQGQAVAGWIYDPIADEMFAALPNDPQLYCNGKPLPAPTPAPLRNAIGFIDFKRLKTNTATQFVTHPPCRSYRNFGSCALEWAWLASGRAQFIIHGGESVWDFAAGLALAARSRCIITDFNGDFPLQQGNLRASIIATRSQQQHDGLSQAILEKNEASNEIGLNLK